MLWPHLDEFVDKTVKFIKRGQAIPDASEGEASAAFDAFEVP
jgi:hypothetical protein